MNQATVHAGATQARDRVRDEAIAAALRAAAAQRSDCALVAWAWSSLFARKPNGRPTILSGRKR